MIRQQDDAFVLRTAVLGEADLIVTLLTETHGQVRAVARSARRSRRRFAGVLEPMTRIRAAWIEKPGRELHVLEQADGLRSFAEMQAEPVRQAACAVLSEIAAGFSREGEADVREFRLLAAVLDAFERGGAPRALLRYFEYWTLRVHGLLPDLESCAACGLRLPAAGRLRVGSRQGPLCRSCGLLPGEREASLGTDERGFVERMRTLPPAELSARPAGPGRGLELLLRGTLESFAERRFRAYRHFTVAESLPADGDPR